MRWVDACAAERARKSTEGSSPKQLFRGKWEAPGFVAFDKKDRHPILIFYMRDAARQKWRRNIKQGCSTLVILDQGGHAIGHKIIVVSNHGDLRLAQIGEVRR